MSNQVPTMMVSRYSKKKPTLLSQQTGKKKKKYKNLSETLTNANGKYPLQYPIIPFSRYICFAVLRNVVGLLPTCCFVVKFFCTVSIGIVRDTATRPPIAPCSAMTDMYVYVYIYIYNWLYADLFIYNIYGIVYSN